MYRTYNGICIYKKNYFGFIREQNNNQIVID